MTKSERDKADHAKNRARRLDQMSQRYADLQAAGLCVQCGEHQVAHSVSRCEKCLEYMRQRMAAKRSR